MNVCIAQHVILELISGYWWVSHVFDGENGAKKKEQKSMTEEESNEVQLPTAVLEPTTSVNVLFTFLHRYFYLNKCLIVLGCSFVLYSS